jgi:hypothetical protein
MKRLLALVALLFLSGCATYNDPYYSDRYYERRAYDHYYYDDHYYRGRSWVHSSWYYDLYDPYSMLFYPFGYLYDPFWNDYRFGFWRHPSRYWAFSFYGGRPWFYSPWYGGYGIYYPYGYRHDPPRRRSGVPSHVSGSSGESAQTAARGMAAEIHGGAATGAFGNTIVRNSPVRVSSLPGYRADLLGTMATDHTRINGLPTGGWSDRSNNPTGLSNARAADGAGSTSGLETRTGLPGARSRYRDNDAGFPLERAGFRSLGVPGGTVNRGELPADSNTYGLPGNAAPVGMPTAPRYSLPAPEARPPSGSTHPWRDSGNRSNAPSWNNAPSRERSMPGINTSQPRSEPRSFPSAPRMERSTPAPSSRSHGVPGGGRDHD